MDVHVYHNIISNRFEVNVNSGLCELDYESEGIDTLIYTRTFVPEDSRHQGIGHKLVKEALEYARTKQYHVRPACPFVQKVIDEEKDKYIDLIV